jgi:hypothetical protein
MASPAIAARVVCARQRLRRELGVADLPLCKQLPPQIW